MARKAKGKPLTLRPIRLDDDVWAECQRLGKEHGTINEGLATAQAALRMQEAQGRVMAETGDPWKAVAVAMPSPVLDGMMNQGRGNQDPDVPLSRVVDQELKRQNQGWKRGPRPKGDKTR